MKISRLREPHARLAISFLTIAVFATSALAASDSPNDCPFKSSNAEVSAIWKQAESQLKAITTKNQSCRTALDTLIAGLGDTNEIASALQDPSLADRSRLRYLERRILVISGQLATMDSRLKVQADTVTTLGISVDDSSPGSSESSDSSTTSTSLDSSQSSQSSAAVVDLARSGSGSSNPEISALSSELSRDQQEVESLRRQIQRSDDQRNANARNTAAKSTFERLSGALGSIRQVQSMCQGSDVSAGSAAAQAGLRLFATASPLIFGASQLVGPIASLLSSVVNVFTGPTESERATRMMTNLDDLEDLSCFYFNTMKFQCNATRGGVKNVRSADRVRLEAVRSLFEGRDAALGTKMRQIFDRLYSSKQELGPAQIERIPQLCALMSSVPGKSDRCSETNANLGPTYGSCAYVDYYEKGTSTGGTSRPDFPVAPPGGGLSGARGAR